jgi:hypothetical protein
MRRFFQAALVLVFFMQAASVSADMVVYGGWIVDRSTLRVSVRPHESWQIQVNFYWGGVFMGADSAEGHVKFLCNEKFNDKVKETVDVVLERLDKDKYINPFDIFKKAGLTGCKIIR